MRTRLLLVLLFCAGCAHPRHVAVVTDTAIYEMLNDAHAIEQRALCGQASCAGIPPMPMPGWSTAKSVTFNRALLPAVDGGRQFNAVLATWKPGQPMPSKLHDLINGLSASLAQVASDFPDGTTKTAIVTGIGQAQSLILTAIDAYFTIKGGQ